MGVAEILRRTPFQPLYKLERGEVQVDVDLQWYSKYKSSISDKKRKGIYNSIEGIGYMIRKEIRKFRSRTVVCCEIRKRLASHFSSKAWWEGETFCLYIRFKERYAAKFVVYKVSTRSLTLEESDEAYETIKKVIEEGIDK